MERWDHSTLTAPHPALARLLLSEALSLGGPGFGQAVDDERYIEAAVGVSYAVSQVESLHHADEPIGQVRVVLRRGQIAPECVSLRTGEDPVGVGDRLAVDGLGNACVEPLSLQNYFGG